jgi:hypothetical protein
MTELEWCVYYDDGTILCQFDEQGKEHKYTEIVRDKVARVAICGHQILNGKHVASPIKSILIEKGALWWYRRTTAMEIYTGTGGIKRQTYFYVLGHEGRQNTVIDSLGRQISHPAFDFYVPNLKDYEI